MCQTLVLVFETDNAVKSSVSAAAGETPVLFSLLLVGYYEISALKSFAEEKLGNSFDSTSFNEAILKAAMCPFKALWKERRRLYRGGQRPAA